MNIEWLLVGIVGFEPTNEGVKVPCLTAWLYPKILAQTVRIGRTTLINDYVTHCLRIARCGGCYFAFLCVRHLLNVSIHAPRTQPSQLA